MKIISLSALNINSLKGKIDIDFEQLTKDSSLFAIVGATGSGKSTLLDIISCALYGRTARLKNPNNLLSRHCGEGYCEVEFEVKGYRYRSSWRVHRANKKPDGKFQPTKMELVNLTDDKILPIKSGKVPKKVEELSGLDFGRFTQSMMLSQGGFDAFLRATEKERSALLEEITGTQIYAQISMAVYEKFRGLRDEIASDKRVIESIELMDSELVEHKSKELLVTKELKIELDKRLQELSKSIEWVKSLSVLVEDDRVYQQRFIVASSKREENRVSFERLDRANRALGMMSSYSRQKNLIDSISKDKERLDRLSIELELLDKDISLKSQEYTKSHTTLVDEQKIYSDNCSKLRLSRDIQRDKKQTSSSIKEEERRVAQKDKSLLDTKKSLRELEEELDTHKLYKSSVEDEESIWQNLQDIQRDISTIEQRDINLATLNSIALEIRPLLESQAILIEEIESLKIDIDSLRDKKSKEQLLKNYQDDRERLIEGEECFLCGATSHPYIGKDIDIDIDKTKQEIEVKEKRLEGREAELKKIDIKIAKIESQEESIRAKLKELTPREEDRAKLKESENRATNQLSYIKLLRKSESRRVEYSTIISTLTKEIAVDRANLLKLKEKLELLTTKQLEILNVASLDIYEEEITAHFKAIEKREQNLKSELDILMANQKSSSKQIEELSSKLLEDTKELDIVDRELEELYRVNGFANSVELEEAYLKGEKLEELSRFCRDIEDSYRELKSLKEQIAKKLKEHREESISDKSIEELEREELSAKERLDEVSQNIGSLTKELEINQKNIDNSREKIALLKKREERFMVWVKLNELIGSADGAKFKKYAQGITLDQLIYLANQHLEILSSRYTLIRAEESLLELEVLDGYQGNVSRPVTTLSGGESFIVSLALALGLSKLASQKISIDSLFLDEGFGTLDEDSLNTALDALNLLGSGGKMIGVISHVEALKERIPLQIKIIPIGDGSSRVELD